jgi:hypothetical protein
MLFRKFDFKTFILSTIFLFNFSSQAFSKTWTLSDNNLLVLFDDQTGTFSVTDKRCKKTWEQLPLKEKFAVENIVQQGNKLNLKLSGKYNLDVEVVLNDESALEFHISGENSLAIADFEFPSAFKTPDKNHFLVMTDGEGLLLQADDKEYPMSNGVTYYTGGGLAMAWMGVVDPKFETGYMAILETPYDAGLRTRREDGLVTFSPLWLPSMQKFGYSRKVSYHFFDKGGYVAQAKTYRKYIWEKNSVLSLKEKQKRFPALEKMLGGVHIYVWDKARDIEFAKELKSSGIDKALFLWDANHIPYPERGYDNQLKELGYATGGYELFTDLKTRDTAFYEYDFNGPMRFAHTVYPGKFNQLAARKSDGKTYFNQFGIPLVPRLFVLKFTGKWKPKSRSFHTKLTFWMYIRLMVFSNVIRMNIRSPANSFVRQ